MPTIELRSEMTEPQLCLVMEMLDSVRDVPGEIVEIGAYKCGTSAQMAMLTPKTVYAFDIFGGYPYGQGTAFDHLALGDEAFEEIKSVASFFPNLRLVRGMHEETIPKWAKQKIPISFLLMDSDFYPSHKVALEHLWPLVNPDGVIVFHDWTFEAVQQAVRETISIDDVLMLTNRDLHNMGVLRKL